MKSVILKNGDQFSSIIRGIWQLSQGHQNSLPSDLSDLMAPVQDAMTLGFNTFDCADIYTGAEELLGQARARLSPMSMRVHTKYVPDLEQLDHLSFGSTRKIIERSLRRLHCETLELVQFHWWDYSQSGYLDALQHLAILQKEGKIKAIGLTNFNTSHLDEIIQAGFEIATIQFQCSLVDKRSLCQMKGLCEKHGIKRLAYGTLLGGFMSEKWLGKSEPEHSTLENRSLVKYKLLIDDWGGWKKFQLLLSQVDSIAKKYQVTLSQVVIQTMIETQMVDAVIVGLSASRFSVQNRDLLKTLSLTKEEQDLLLGWDCPLPGDVYDLERRGKHAQIMRYNQNRMGSD